MKLVALMSTPLAGHPGFWLVSSSLPPVSFYWMALREPSWHSSACCR